MASGLQKGSQIHVRVSADLKKAVKIFCVREGTTEQSWVVRLVQAELAKRAPDLLSTAAPAKKTRDGR